MCKGGQPRHGCERDNGGRGAESVCGNVGGDGSYEEGFDDGGNKIADMVMSDFDPNRKRSTSSAAGANNAMLPLGL